MSDNDTNDDTANDTTNDTNSDGNNDNGTANDNNDDGITTTEPEGTTTKTTEKHNRKKKKAPKPPRRTLHEALAALQRELLDGLTLRTIHMHRLGVNLIKGHEHTICSKTPNGNVTPANTTKGPIQTLLPGAKPPLHVPKSATPTTKSPKSKHPCEHLRCRISRITKTTPAGEATTPAGKCDQCRQLASAQALCNKLERLVIKTPTLQRTLAERTYWTRDEMTNLLIEEANTKRVIDEDYRGPPGTDLTRPKHVRDAAQLLASTILKRPSTEHREYDPTLTSEQLNSLDNLIHARRCQCNTTTLRLAAEITPPICYGCNLVRQHQNATPQTCPGCAKPTKLKQSLCATCKIGALCSFNSAAARWTDLTATIDHPGKLLQQARRQPPTLNTRPIPTIEGLFPINTIKEQRILTVRHKIKSSNETSEFYHHYTKIYNQPPHTSGAHAHPLQLQCLRRLDPAVSTAQYMDDEGIVRFLHNIRNASNRKDEIGIISPYLTRKMDDNTLFGDTPIRQTRHQTKPWIATKDHVTILIPFQKHLHWTLAILHKPKGLLHYDSGGESGNRLILEKAIHKTIPTIKQTTKLKRAQGPLQPNQYICGDCACLVAYAWCFHPAPWTIDWEKLTNIDGFFPRWRRLIRYSLCTGEIYNIFSHFDIPTISTKEQRKISAFVEAKAATIATTGRAIRQPISLIGSDHSAHTNDWDGIILEDTPNDSRNPDPEIPDTISIQPSHAATGNTNIPAVEITSAAPNGILDTTMDSVQSNTILDETMNSALSEMSIATTNAEPGDLDIANINITDSANKPTVNPP